MVSHARHHRRFYLSTSVEVTYHLKGIQDVGHNNHQEFEQIIKKRKNKNKGFM
jgi:hypothetical protein